MLFTINLSYIIDEAYTQIAAITSVIVPFSIVIGFAVLLVMLCAHRARQKGIKSLTPGKISAINMLIKDVQSLAAMHVSRPHMCHSAIHVLSVPFCACAFGIVLLWTSVL